MIKHSVESDIGNFRENNEDSFLIIKNHFGDTLYVVADGMGGHNAGDVASQMAVDIMKEQFLSYQFRSDYSDFLVQSIKAANDKIYKKSLMDINLEKMGTTISCLILSDNKMYIGHIGDSRIYYIDQTQITQLTKDHTLVQSMIDAGTLTTESAKNNSFRNVLTQALGTSKKITIDILEFSLPKKYNLIICSDGLTEVVDDQGIEKISNLDKTIDRKVKLLVEKALTTGGKDNITVVGIEKGVHYDS